MNPPLEKEVEAFDEIAKNGRYSSYVVDRFCCGGDYCMDDHNGWIRDYFTQALERTYQKGYADGYADQIFTPNQTQP